MEHYTANKRWAKLENFKPETTTAYNIPPNHAGVDQAI